MKQPKRIRLCSASEPVGNPHLSGFTSAMKNVEQAAGEVATGLKHAAESLREAIGQTAVVIKPPR